MSLLALLLSAFGRLENGLGIFQPKKKKKRGTMIRDGLETMRRTELRVLGSVNTFTSFMDIAIFYS